MSIQLLCVRIHKSCVLCIMHQDSVLLNIMVHFFMVFNMLSAPQGFSMQLLSGSIMFKLPLLYIMAPTHTHKHTHAIFAHCIHSDTFIRGLILYYRYTHRQTFMHIHLNTRNIVNDTNDIVKYF